MKVTEIKSIEYSFPTKIRFGNGISQNIHQELVKNTFKKPLLVTDSTLLEFPWFQKIKGNLVKHEIDVSIYSNFSGNPIESYVIQGKALYKENDLDCIIAVGGGTVIDVAKAILILVSHDGNLFDYEDGKKGSKPIDQPTPFFMVIPTTAGTGSEVGRSTVISDDKTKNKRIIFSPSLLPDIVFIDPVLTLNLPANITAATGMDALTHCIEAYLVNSFHPFCDGIALEGLRLIVKSFIKCIEFAEQGFPDTEEHLKHRGVMLNASMMGAIAFQKGLGVNHSCAHALSTVYDLHHGLANGIMLPYCMEFNKEVCKKKYMNMIRAMDIEESTPEGFIEWIVRLKDRCKIPKYLSELNLDITKKTILVEVASQDACHRLNPKKVIQEDFWSIFSRAFHE